MVFEGRKFEERNVVENIDKLVEAAQRLVVKSKGSQSGSTGFKGKSAQDSAKNAILLSKRFAIAAKKVILNNAKDNRIVTLRKLEE